MATLYSNSPSGRVSVARRAASLGLWALVAIKADAVPRHKAVTVLTLPLPENATLLSTVLLGARCSPIRQARVKLMSQKLAKRTLGCFLGNRRDGIEGPPVDAPGAL